MTEGCIVRYGHFGYISLIESASGRTDQDFVSIGKRSPPADTDAIQKGAILAVPVFYHVTVRRRKYYCMASRAELVGENDIVLGVSSNTDHFPSKREDGGFSILGADEEGWHVRLSFKEFDRQIQSFLSVEVSVQTSAQPPQSPGFILQRQVLYYGE